ncbi:MAG: DUF2004 domain-containing protein [Haliscomenobacter sp.]|uniref:DUF2004 domain-containing protein n=1 Tax=Haliscomenobacter sp. TaxID=2717303 RepID=UPI0029A58DED|nr:DUF2004 domain-containing protein [Haliscomenobacter sp.]MDX2067919.1 DUF2004 domain-containing protein [Haliscomenobacter sp.]
MTYYLLPPFGQINLDALNEEYRSEIEFNGKTITLDINFAKTNIEKSAMDTIKFFIENIDTFDRQNKVNINSDFNDENGDTVKEYVTFHIEELGDEFLEQIDITSDQTDKEQQFLKKLHLTRIGLYPDGKYDASNFAVFDYTVSKDLTDQLIVVNTDEKGNLDHLSWES